MPGIRRDFILDNRVLCSIHYTYDNFRPIHPLPPRNTTEGRPQILGPPGSQTYGHPTLLLSKVERGEVAPPSEETTRKLARELEVDSDVLLAMAGKVSSDLQDVIRKRPALFAELIRQLKEMPDHAVVRLVREVRDGEW